MKYSQHDEERYILESTPNSGQFLDIGAWNPKTLSNTRALYERGWRGVMVEPSPEPFLTLLKEYGSDPNMKLICAAVAGESGLTRFYATADAVSTSDEINYERWKEQGGYYGAFYGPTITVAQILNQFGGFAFVNIDAEGQSFSIFKALIETEMRPDCYCVEHDGRLVELLGFAHAAGYKAIYTNGENVVLGR